MIKDLSRPNRTSSLAMSACQWTCKFRDISTRPMHQRCIAHVSDWMKSNRLDLNPSKTEFVSCSTTRRQHLIDNSLILIGKDKVQLTSSVRNLGVFMDQAFTMLHHISSITGRCFNAQWKIKSIHLSLTHDANKTLVCSRVLSRLDYCNTLLSGLPSCSLRHIKSVLNMAAHVIYQWRKYDPITITMCDKLHWLPIKQHIKYKICLMVFKALNGLAQKYIADMCTSTLHDSFLNWLQFAALNS